MLKWVKISQSPLAKQMSRVYLTDTKSFVGTTATFTAFLNKTTAPGISIFFLLA